MSETKVLLNSYYEVLYERLEAKKTLSPVRIEQLLSEEIERQGFRVSDQEKFQAYQEAAQAFVVERIETYNPVGVQYTFEQGSPEEVWEFEAQLNWYDSREEFETLVRAARRKAQQDLSHQKLRQLAEELIQELGAYPDQSIIEGYQAQPTLRKLPDYVVARVVEELVRQDD